MTAGQQSRPKKFVHALTREKLAAEERKGVELIRQRALQYGASDLVEMCDQDLASRPPVNPTTRRPRSAGESRSSSDVVIGYHFVCGKERGVITADAGKFWSGSWVVAEGNARKSLDQGAYLALHETKIDLSYKQGKLVDYRRTKRDMVSKDETGSTPQTEEGIEFLVEETSQPYEWVGKGSGEKGYLWASDKASADQLGQISISQAVSA